MIEEVQLIKRVFNWSKLIIKKMIYKFHKYQ